MLKLVADNGAPCAVSGERRALLAQVHIARKALAMQDDDYRAALEQATGHRSAKDCDDHQLRAVIARFEQLGFRPIGGGSRRRVGGSQTVRKARAMWISLYQLGAVQEASDAALDAFGRRQLKVDRLQWADERQGYRLIEALKAIATRYGWDQRVPSRMATRERIRLLKDRLVGAQLARLAAAGMPVSGPVAGDRVDWSEKRLESAAAELADRVRTLPRITSAGTSAARNAVKPNQIEDEERSHD
ncbi:phage protein GemA/Gp16 family protein [Novosphingobium colocasiae]|uniref:phage protein GemA/Gp16 family protein n=1 Tax=Novosphingobium colocasiae TaxID=1256513 RepID=UPI0035AEEEBF